jgi:hypothetical protein
VLLRCQQSGTEHRRKNGLLPTIWNGASAVNTDCNHFYQAITIPCWPARIWRRFILRGYRQSGTEPQQHYGGKNGTQPTIFSGGAENLERSLVKIMAGKRNETIFSGVADNLDRCLGNIMAGKKRNHFYQAQHHAVLACANIEHIFSLGC